MGNDDKMGSIIGGILAAMTICIENPSRRSKISLFLLSRAVMSAMSLSDDRDIVKKRKYGETFFFACLGTFAIYLFLYEIDVFPKGTEKIFWACCAPKVNDDIMINEWRETAKTWFK